MSVLFVKPLTGLIVRNPKTKAAVPSEGQFVDIDSGIEGTYWKRRIADGSLIVVVSQDHDKVMISIHNKKKGER